MAIETQDLTPELWDAYETLLKPTDGCDGCWCYNHHIRPGAPDLRGEQARLAFKKLLGSGQAHGVLAFDNGEPAGWCAVDRRIDIPGHDCTLPFTPELEDSIWSIHCFYIKPSSRGKGITRLLLEHAQDLIRSKAGTLVEGYPTPPNDEGFIFDFSGPYAIFAEQGFTKSEEINADYCRVIKRL